MHGTGTLAIVPLATEARAKKDIPCSASYLNRALALRPDDSRLIAEATSLGARTAPAIRKLAALSPNRLALMHGSSFSGDCAGALDALADYYAASLRKALS